jgi:hypothetical protein
MRITIIILGIVTLILQSCGGTHLATENKRLKNKIADLELRVYELTDSPDQLAKDLLQDVNLLMTIPYEDNLDLALAMLDSYKESYPKNYFSNQLNEKEEEIKSLLNQNQGNHSFEVVRNKNAQAGEEEVKLQFSVQVSERNSGFSSVAISVQNLSDQAISNIWFKASLLDLNGNVYGLTQDYFFNRLNAYEQKSEELSWEYVKTQNIGGIKLQQIRYSSGRQTKLLKKMQGIIGQGNVKIFLEI